MTKHKGMHERTDMERATLLGRHVLESIVTESSEAVVLLDAQNPERPVVYANTAYEALTGCCASELIGRPWPLLGEDSVVSPEIERLRIAAGRGEACDVTVTGVCGGGDIWCGDVSLRPLHATHGEVEYLLCRYRSAPAEQSEPSSRVEVGLLRHALGQARQRIASLDRTDPVTGLLRYEHFMTLLAHDLGTARREGLAVSVIGFEIVELDVYRQTFGEKAADSSLRMIGAQVAGAFRRTNDSCTRSDASTILAAVVGQTPEAAAALAERVAGKVRGLGLHNPRACSGRQLWVQHAVVGAEPSAEDAKAVVERVKAALAGSSALPERTRSAV